MAVKIIVPKLGISTEPLTIVEWKAKEGEHVEKGSVVLVVGTEKIRHSREILKGRRFDNDYGL